MPSDITVAQVFAYIASGIAMAVMFVGLLVLAVFFVWVFVALIGGALAALA